MTVCVPPDSLWCAPDEHVAKKRRAIAESCGTSPSKVRAKDWVKGDIRRVLDHAQNCMRSSTDSSPRGAVDAKQSD
eukprot:14522151-Alexandrium_andersonii.AAC.1